MPRYFFHCQLGDFLASDGSGYDLPSIAAARQEAMSLMSELARDEFPAEGTPPNLVINVTDGEQHELFSVSMLVDGVA